jgi:hypothetical protein
LIFKSPIPNQQSQIPEGGVTFFFSPSSKQITNLKNENKMNQLVEILVPFGGMALAFGIVYFVVTTKHKERMRLIENGANPELFYNKEQKRGQAIKFGALLIGVGLGLVLANILKNAEIMSGGVATPAMVLIFGGAGLLIGNYFVDKAEKEKHNP